jgi:hypothetical protein
MFVKVSVAGATLEDVDNFKAFKVISDATPEHREPVLAAIGRIDGDHVWIDSAWLRRNGRPDDALWLAGFEKMAAYAKGAGWIDEHGAIRAHIETT